MVTLVVLEQLNKLATTSGGKWECNTMGRGYDESGEVRAVLGCACIYLGRAVGPGSRTPPQIVLVKSW